MENKVKKIYDFIKERYNDPYFDDNAYSERIDAYSEIMHYIKENFESDILPPKSCNNCKRKYFCGGKLMCDCCSYDDYKYCCEEIPEDKREIIANTCEYYERKE